VPDLSTLDERIEAYASWVRMLRSGHDLPALPTDTGDPLARLGDELRLLSATLSRREAELRGLFHLVHTVERGILLDDVLSKIFDAFKGLIPYDRIGCAFLSDDADELVAYWARSELGPLQIQRGYRGRMAGSSLQQVLSSRQPRILNDLEEYLRAKPDSDATRRIVAEGGRSSLTCPLLVDDRPLGFLFFTSREPSTYNDAHQSVFQQIADQVAVVIEKSRVYERLVEHNRRLKKQTRRLEALARSDALTGALSRRALDADIERAWSAFATRGTPFGVVLLDIDHFKQINDAYGHPAGDTVLREVVLRIAAQLRKRDVCGRYGGEEFLVVVPDTIEQQLLPLAERLRTALADSPMGADGDIAVTASCGAAHAGGGAASWRELVQQADDALYRAKAAGRNRSVLASSFRA
jgi:diguanylate cyclase (GGDEF)-like protein